MKVIAHHEFDFADLVWVGAAGAQASYARALLPQKFLGWSGVVGEIKFRQTTGTITLMRIGVTGGQSGPTAPTAPDNTTPDEKFAFLDTAAVPPAASATGPVYSNGPGLTSEGSAGFSAGDKWLYIFLTTVTGAAWSAGKVSLIASMNVN